MSTYYMKNIKEAVEYCFSSVKSVRYDLSCKYDKFYEVSLYDNEEPSYKAHIDTVYMNKRTFNAYVGRCNKKNIKVLEYREG